MKLRTCQPAMLKYFIQYTVFSESQKRCISMATILEFLLKYAVQSSNYGGYLKLLKVIQDCHQNYCFKLCILEETPNLWPWKYDDHNTLCLIKQFLILFRYRYSGCHSYDNSALNILLGLAFSFDETKYISKEKLFASMDEITSQETEESETTSSLNNDNTTQNNNVTIESPSNVL